MRKLKERIIYCNTNLWNDYANDVSDFLKEEYGEEPTEESIWEEIYFRDETMWEDAKETLSDFFSTGTWILQGTEERWSGKYKSGYIFTDFMEMFNKAAEDCDFIKMWDENGHFYLQCSHHDGTNTYEVKKLTNAGKKYLENWEYNYSDHRSMDYVYTMVMKRYSTLPHYANIVFGCQKFDYEKRVA